MVEVKITMISKHSISIGRDKMNKGENERHNDLLERKINL